MNRPDVSIIIVSWNTSDYLERCLAAIPRAAAGLTIEIIVVDNGSTDGTQAMLAEKFPRVRVIQNPENLGFGRANNVGAWASQGRTILLLNSDCELQASALEAMVSALDRDPSLGAVFCRLLNPDGTLQPSVHSSFLSPWSTIGDLFFLSSLRYAVYRTPVLHRWLLWGTVRAHAEAHDVAWGGGACLLIRRAVLEATGGFDERFFMYYEDLDLCKRIRDAGYRLRYLPGPTAVHHWGVSTSQRPSVMLQESHRSRISYFEKHFPGWGGSVARWTALRELEIRRLACCLLALVPSRHRQSFQEHATVSGACLEFIRASQAHKGEQLQAAIPGLMPFLLTLVILLSLFRYVHDLAKLLVDSPFIDFAHYYTLATVVSLGRDPFDPQAVAYVDALLNIRRAGGAAVYPPLFYLVMQPWTLLPFRHAVAAWCLGAQILLGATVFLWWSRYNSLRPILLAGPLFVVLNYQPLLEDLYLGQSNVLLLFLLTLAWWGLVASRPWVVAGALATTLHIKVQFALLILLLWRSGLRAVALRTILLWGIGVGIGLLVLGSDHYLEYIRHLWGTSVQYGGWTANHSLYALLHRVFGVTPEGQLLAAGLTLGLGALILVLLARVIPRALPVGSCTTDWVWGLGLCTVLILSPLTEEHHLVVLLLPLALLLFAASEGTMSVTEQTVFVGSILLLATPYSLDRFPIFHHGALSLFTSGKLLGVAGLAWVLIGRLHARANSDGGS